MIDLMILFWLAIFGIFFISSVIGNSSRLAVLAGIILLIFGMFIMLDGVQVQSGMNITDINGTQSIMYSYDDAVTPVSSYAIVWGLIFVLISLYLILEGARKA